MVDNPLTHIFFHYKIRNENNLLTGVIDSGGIHFCYQLASKDNTFEYELPNKVYLTYLTKIGEYL